MPKNGHASFHPDGTAGIPIGSEKPAGSSHRRQWDYSAEEWLMDQALGLRWENQTGLWENSNSLPEPELISRADAPDSQLVQINVAPLTLTEFSFQRGPKTQTLCLVSKNSQRSRGTLGPNSETTSVPPHPLHLQRAHKVQT
uniref:Uncharacterized protein n=1 Tax=Chelydra serpentina TaxID=8475 RepID=A0A8C3SR04_CHESE